VGHWTKERIGELIDLIGLSKLDITDSPDDRLALKAIGEELSGWSRCRESICLVVPDATRLLPEELVTVCLDALTGKQLEVVIGTGLHRPPSPGEWRTVSHLSELRGRGITIHTKGGQTDTIAVKGASERAFSWHRAVVEADGVVTLGVVELHQYAGFTGGVKGVVVGTGSPDTIGWIHRPALLRDPFVTVGVVEGNLFRQQLTRMAECLPQIFEVQVAHSETGTSFHTGVDEKGWNDAVKALSAFYPVPLSKGAVVSVMGAKGINLYQASRGVTQLLLRPDCPVVPGAPVVLLTEGVEGIGQGPGEQLFKRWLVKGKERLLQILSEIDSDTLLGGGAQRAFVVAMASDRNPVGYVALQNEPALDRFGWRYLGDVEEVLNFLGDDYLSVPDPLHRLPCFDAAL
jgi:nickel-dependent lactate racemase